MKNLKVIALAVITITMCTAAMAQNTISVNWTKSIAGQTITGYSEQYTASVPTSITSIPYNYEINLWDAAGNYSKVAEGTTTMLPKVLSFNGNILINRGQSEPVKVMNSSGTVIAEKVILATLSVYNISSETKYFYTGSSLVRATYTTKPGPSNEYSTKVETFTDSLNLISSKEFVGMQFVGISGDFLAGNMNDKGKLVSISNTNSTKDFTAPITGLKAQGNDIYVLADKLYKLDGQLTEVWNKAITGTNLEFIADKAVIFNGTAAILYDSLFTNSLSTITVNQSSLIGISNSDNAIYVATSSLLSRIVLHSPNGIEENIQNENSILPYPNPTVNQITITGLPDNSTVEIMNAIGQHVITTNKNSIDVSSLPAGLYHCRIDGLITKQFIKR